MEKQEKLIKEVFPDYTFSNAIAEGKIVKIDLFKKSNKLEIEIKAKSYISLKEVSDFEKYLKNRFQIELVRISTRYEEETLLPKLEEQWGEMWAYIGEKNPTTKIMLKNSKVKIEGTNFTVILPSKGADMLIKRGFVQAMENLIFRMRGEKYKVQYIEQLDEKEMKKYEESARLAEKLAVELAQQEAQAALDEETKQYKKDVGANATVRSNTQKDIQNNVGVRGIESGYRKYYK